MSEKLFRPAQFVNAANSTGCQSRCVDLHREKTLFYKVEEDEKKKSKVAPSGVAVSIFKAGAPCSVLGRDTTAWRRLQVWKFNLYPVFYWRKYGKQASACSLAKGTRFKNGLRDRYLSFVKYGRRTRTSVQKLRNNVVQRWCSGLVVTHVGLWPNGKSIKQKCSLVLERWRDLEQDGQRKFNKVLCIMYLSQFKTF